MTPTPESSKDRSADPGPSHEAFVVGCELVLARLSWLLAQVKWRSNRPQIRQGQTPRFSQCRHSRKPATCWRDRVASKVHSKAMLR